MSQSQPEFVAFPEENGQPAFIALRLPKEMVPPPEMLALSDGLLVRFRSEEGFKRFMVAAIETASLVWPEIAAEWRDTGDES